MSLLTKRNTAIGLALFAVSILAYWWFSSGSLLTLTKIAVEKKDELFGTTYIEWQDGFKLGLEYTALISAPLMASSILFYRNYRKQLKNI